MQFNHAFYNKSFRKLEYYSICEWTRKYNSAASALRGRKHDPWQRVYSLSLTRSPKKAPYKWGFKKWSSLYSMLEQNLQGSWSSPDWKKKYKSFSASISAAERRLTDPWEAKYSSVGTNYNKRSKRGVA